VFKKLFPGSTMQDAGPCQAVMASNFKPGTCVGEAKRCSVLVADMLDVCVGQVWPDIPKGNQPHVGSMFTNQRAKAMKVAFERAGCAIPKKVHAKPTYHPTYAPVPATPAPTFKPDPEETAHQTARENQFEQSLQSAGYNQWQAPAPAPANQKNPLLLPGIAVVTALLVAVLGFTAKSVRLQPDDDDSEMSERQPIAKGADDGEGQDI